MAKKRVLLVKSSIRTRNKALTQIDLLDCIYYPVAVFKNKTNKFRIEKRVFRMKQPLLTFWQTIHNTTDN